MKYFFYVLLLILFVNSCKSFETITENHDTDTRQTKSSDRSSGNSVTSHIAALDANSKKGLLLMVSIPDTVLSLETAKFLLSNNITGIILFSHNIVNENQLRKLTNDIRTKIRKDILIAIDQEGGTVVRIPWDKYASYTASYIGKKNNYEFAYKIAYERAVFLLSLGINVILGPVCDIAESGTSYMYSRSFGTDPVTVSKMVEATVRAQKDAGIITVLKHFPGHGATTVDSHALFPVIKRDREYLFSHDLLPFIKGIEAGADMVMTGHIINPSIDSSKPASLSSIYLSILNQLNFQGIIITDDLSMTGTIESGISWGINLISGEFTDIMKKMITVEPESVICEKVYLLTKKAQKAGDGTYYVSEY